MGYIHLAPMWYDYVVDGTTGNETGNMMDTKLTVTRDAIDWDTLVNVVTDPLTRAWIVDGMQRARYDHVARHTVANVTLTVDGWHGVLVDIDDAVDGVTECDTDTARLFNMRDAIEMALRYDVRDV